MNDNYRRDLAELLEKLEQKRGFDLKMTIGLDGFVDEIIHAVDKRHDFSSFTRIENIVDLGERIVKAASLSTNIEFVTVGVKLGGNGPILANALIEYGAKVKYIGSVGDPDIHPVFKGMAEKSAGIYPLCEPGHTDALEFNDGKLLLGKLTTMSRIDWKRFKEVVGGVEGIAEIVKESKLFGMENWTMIPYMSEIWEGIIEEVFPLLPDDENRIAFFDLADPEKRTREDILHAMSLIGKFGEKFKTILGLNEKELYEIADVFGIDCSAEPENERLKYATKRVFERLGIYCLVAHPTKEAVCCVGGNIYHAYGPYCEKPLLTTGAGDNFNAGFCLGQALDLDPQSSLMLGVFTSGYYVRNAKSPTFEDVIGFIKGWLAE